MALKNSSEYSSIVVVDIAKSAPSVSTGPKARKIAINVLQEVHEATGLN